MKRVLLAGMRQETNSFVPGLMTLDDFRRCWLAEGERVLSPERGEGDQISGILAVAADHGGIEIVPIFDAFGLAGPPVSDDAYQYMRQKILGGVRQHCDTIDGIILPWHGAMTTPTLDDPEGDLLAGIRAIVGPNIPIVAGFDMHGHMTDAMAQHADGIVVYHTSPHVDIYETGVRQMRLLCQALDSAVMPVVAHRKFRMTASSEAHDTNRPPMQDVIRHLEELERRPGVLSANIFATQPWLDVAEHGWSIVVTADGDRALAQRTADEVARIVWNRREEFRVTKTPIVEAVAAALASDRRPFVLSDGADSPSAGSTGDGNQLLRYLIETGYQETAMLTLTDPDAAARCHAAGVGAELTLSLGGKLAPTFNQPVTVSGRVKTLTDGRYLMKYPPAPATVGPTAVLEVGGISIVLTTHPALMLDLETFKMAGLDPTTPKIVQPKSAGGYRAFYTPIAAGIFDLDTVGPSGSDQTKLPFRKIRRPLWPFDPDLEQPW